MDKIEGVYEKDVTGLLSGGLDWMVQYSRHPELPRKEDSYIPSQGIVAGTLHALFRMDLGAFSTINSLQDLSYIQYFQTKSWLNENYQFPEKVLKRCMTSLAWMVVKKRLSVQSVLVAVVTNLDDKGIFAKAVIHLLKDAWRKIESAAGSEGRLVKDSAFTELIEPVLELVGGVWNDATESAKNESGTPEVTKNNEVSDLPEPRAAQDKTDGAIHKAAAEGRLEAVMELLERGVPVDIRGDSGYTPLQYAAKYGRLEVVRWLVQRGADLNLGNNWNWTPLHHASYYGRYDIARILIDAGAEPRIVDTVYGKTPFGWAGYDLKMVKLFKSKAIYS